MAGSGASSNASRLRKRVEADTSPASLKRARDGSAFAKCDECNKDVPVALISFHNCSLDAKIKMNLEAQVVEMSSEAKKKPTTENKKRLRKTEPSSKKGKSAKDPNMPKRPSTAFFVFMEDFRKSFKESNPDCKGGAKVAKEGGEAWKALSDEEKKVYVDKAADLKADYEKAMKEYNGVDDEQEADDAADKEVKEEADVEDEPEKEVKEEADVEDEPEKEVKEDADLEDEQEKEVKEEELEDDV